MGNICRSPTAHAVMQHKVNERGLQEHFQIESSGTHAYHVGDQADKRSRATAKLRGIGMDDLRAQKISVTDYDYFDWILAMDKDNLELINYYAPEGAEAKIDLFLNFAKDFPDTEEVPDPYYGGPEGFEHVFDLVDDACEGLIEHLMA